MGINTAFANLLVRAKLQGTSFSEIATIGRQSLYIPRYELLRMASSLGQTVLPRTETDHFADSFFRLFLSANSISAIDYSDYQQADIVHDLNLPISDEFENSFDVVIDGGSLEHIFDVKQALTNYMKLVRSGGSVFILTTANNLCGHGFYQFSPEFFYRVFEPSNGFETKDVVIMESPLLSVEKSKRVRYFRVRDPSEVGKRIQLVNRQPTMIFVHARKIADKTPFKSPPLQSDYRERKWAQKRVSAPGEQAEKKVEDTNFLYLSPWEEARRRFRQRRKNSHRNKRFFKPIEF